MSNPRSASHALNFVSSVATTDAAGLAFTELGVVDGASSEGESDSSCSCMPAELKYSATRSGALQASDRIQEL